MFKKHQPERMLCLTLGVGQPLGPSVPCAQLGEMLRSARQLQTRNLPREEGGLPMHPDRWRYPRMGKAGRSWSGRINLTGPSGGKKPVGLMLPKEQREGIDSKSPLLNITASPSSSFLCCTLP